MLRHGRAEVRRLLLRDFRHLFQGLGCLKTRYRMVLDPDAVPVIQPARRVPLALQEPLKKELQRMTREGIIVKENEPTDWYIPGKHLVLADMLSRSTADNQDEAGATTDVEVHAIQLLGYRVTEATQKELQAATARDRYLQSVIASLSVGLPVQDSGDDFWLGLLAYRSTPLEDGRSPGELLQGRRLRANLPDFSAVTATNVKKHSQAQGGRPLPPLQKGVVVRLRDAAWSRKAQVVGSPYPRSYLVKTEDQKLLRRNRRHLLQTGERFIEESDDDIDTSPADNVGGHPTVATSTSPANGRRREVPTSGDPSPPVVRQSTPPPTPALRRSTRTVKPPQRLHYDKDFNQVSDIIF
ncbi:uncharacterized protein LOC119403985 isoform X3 [Rhipicephalus sanguineus]|uniref:uncharacterized protein LOC119403985 isoform X3 n=1 Tax=Rhipicephalus sanguineus TaxID=34632 RepID=UPI0018945865|nr:uncharacterized protein LOC119403985 isoform X3 [Rhipicephalus sanguineus]